MVKQAHSNERITYERVLAALNEGDMVTFNISGGANAKPTPELVVVLPGEQPSFASEDRMWEIRKPPDGTLGLWVGRKNGPHGLKRRYDTIETIELIAEKD